MLRNSRRVVLTTHTRPDGDAVGSELALARYLDQIGVSVRILNSDPAPYALDWLPGARRLELFDGSLAQREAVATADVIVILDTNSEERLGSLGAAVRASSACKLLIDHHTAPENWFDQTYRDEATSSTGQLVFNVVAADDPDLIDHEMATALYVAIMTDTGSFRFSNVTPAVHRAVATILEKGDIDPAPIHAEIFDKRSLSGIKLLSRVLQTLTVAHGGLVAWMVVSSRSLNDTGASAEETEGFVNWGLSIEGVRVALIFTETEKGTKVSFRSKGTAHVHTWAQALGGGGHPNASGAFVRRPLEDVIQSVLGQAPRYLGEDDTADESDFLGVEDEAYLVSLMNLQNRVKRS